MRRLLWCLPLLAAVSSTLGLAIVGYNLGSEAPARSPLDDPTFGYESAGYAEETRDDSRRPLDAAGLERLARTDAVAFLRESIRRYDRDVQSYTATLVKRERVGGVLHPTERVEISFREKPFSVLMEWKEGFRLARKTLYVRGENNGLLVVKPYGWRSLAGIVHRDPNGADAKSSARYPATEFGIKIGTLRALAAWKAAKDRGELKVIFGGEKKMEELGGLACWELKRVGYTRPEDDGITASTFYFDKQTGLQVGSILEGDGELIGSYWFRDLKLNPTFDADTFTPAAVRK